MKHSFIFRNYIIISMTLRLFVGCQSNDVEEFPIEIIEEEIPELCPDIDMGVFDLLNDSFKSTPYKREKYLYFTDSLNNEITFAFKQKKRTYYTTYSQRTCPLDNSKSFDVTGKIDTYEMWLINEPNKIAIDMLIQIQASAMYFKDTTIVHDILQIITFPKEGGNDINSINIEVDKRTNNYLDSAYNYHQPLDSISLHGKMFYNVYADSNKLYYSYDAGVIALRDASNKLWVIKP